MRLGNLLFLCVRRLRTHPLQELLALAGIAIGVALVYAVLVANASVAGSVRELERGIAGDAPLQLSARSADGLPLATARAAARLPGVATATPLVEARVQARGAGGARTATVVGADPPGAAPGGRLLDALAAPALRARRGVALTSSMAAALGVRGGDRVLLSTGARTRGATVVAVLGERQLGSLAHSPLALARLGEAQRATGLRHRVTRVLLAPRRGQEAAVRARLERLGGGRLDVTSGAEEARRLARAMEPNDQSTGVFAAVSALVGLLLAFNAMLLTVPERRRFFADLRLDGLGDGTVVRLALVDALVLGCAASVAGLLLGELLSRAVFHAIPGYIALAFTVGEQRVVPPGAIVLAVAGGIGATVLAALRPLADLVSSRPLDAVLRDDGRSPDALTPQPRPLAAGLLLTAVSGLLLALAPGAAIPAFALLVAAMLLALPAALDGALRLLALLGRRLRSPVIAVSAGELRTAATRSLALAATAALAVFGSVAVEGSHRDLVEGIDGDAGGMSAQADLWVMPSAGEVLLTERFALAPQRRAALAAVPGVAALRPYRAALLDVGERRTWAIGPPAGGAAPLLPSQLADPGELARATRRLRSGGWVALSGDVADALGARVGDAVALPTPRPLPLRLAAQLTNIGWSGGGVVLNAADFRRAWGSARVGALQVTLAPGASAAATARALARELPPGAALTVATAHERRRQMTAAAEQGLDRLTQIAGLVLVSGALALAAALGAVAWTRRPQLAALKLTGFGDGAVWRVLLLESATVLGVGCAVGVLFGLAGQFVLTWWLRVVSGFPAVYSTAGWLALATCAGVSAVAVAIAALPGYAAARVSPLASLREE